MLFGVKLANEMYKPWAASYIDYERLKRLLKEDDDQTAPKDRHNAKLWTEKDESTFVAALDAELEKVYEFESHKYADLKDKLSAVEGRIPSNGDDSASAQADFDAFEKELDRTLAEAQELEKFTRLNYTGFFKIVKKHDRLYSTYSVRPLLQVRLAALPFNSENYSPILYKLSSLYAYVRDHKAGLPQELHPEGTLSRAPTSSATTTVKSFKFWVHPDNLMEVKTFILRHLPLLIYNPQSNKILNLSTPDPTITTLYFDNPEFQLYLEKLESRETASSVRLRWYGKLNSHPEIFFERKFADPEDKEVVQEQRIPIKEKYVKPFIDGTYSMEKSIRKMRERGSPVAEVEKFEKVVADIQSFIRDNNLQPVLRAVYSRTAFQIPDDDRVRISIDNDIDLIREDALDSTRPIRDPEDWHRHDIDDMGLEHPFKTIRKGEISRFPYAVLEIKVAMRTGDKKIRPSWVKDLMASHLVKEAPKFSKFAHGVSMLFDDEEYINVLPYWLSELEKDIRRDPEQAYAEELNRKKFGDQPLDLSLKALSSSPAAGAFGNDAVASLLAAVGEQSAIHGRQESISISLRSYVDEADREHQQIIREDIDEDEEDESSSSSDEEEVEEEGEAGTSSRRRRKHRKSRARAAKSWFKRHRKASDKAFKLPPGVERPKRLLTQSGQVMVEPKVWLANERTFNKWLQVTVLLSALTFGLYNAAGQYNTTAHRLAYTYFILTIFCGCWGYGVYMHRIKAIQMRSGKHLDSPVGPVVICAGLLAAIILNYYLDA
ncbi:VTC domain-containing protein [Lipomyces tetrasporus]|uniref:VTC domain-containing protein n=1 Tax=Lipomyces tetrasporus TaxID=54092 RepID=A0AAD7QQ67_9ASCO|nr:VTC domain-containing protein [Lipomyces tetrasporus]KAJ8099454.1 VTC domain-containing protein [Lipomyces tetrasporus]